MLAAISSAVGSVGRALSYSWQWLTCTIHNSIRWFLHSRLPDYAVIALDHSISERVPTVPWWYAYIPGLKLPLSLEYITNALRRIAEDPDIKGVVILMKDPGLSLAQGQSMARMCQRFHDWDAKFRQPGAQPKKVIIHLEEVNIPSYLAACGADVITMTPMASWDILGVRAAPVFLKDTLAKFGVEFDVMRIAPWKTAADQFACSEMSEANREQIEWLLESLYEQIMEATVYGRGLEVDKVRELIDRAPLTAAEAKEAGLIDVALYKDEIGTHLQSEDKPASLKTYASTRGLLLNRVRARPGKSVGILNLKGTITGKESRVFPLPIPILGEGTVGSITVEQQIRSARRDSNMAAVIVHVDSGGGSAMASDLICRELEMLSQEKPVVVYMGDVAASGGYYIAAPASKIIAQGASLTGSIGVIVAKPITAGAFDKLDAHREVIQRGDNVGLYAEDTRWTEEQRTQVEAQVRFYYDAFKRVVARGRGLEYESLDDICNGRVWTGRQALALGLVDEIGDFQLALEYACDLSGLPNDGTVRTRNISAPRTRNLPEPANPAKALSGEATLAQLRELAASLLQGDWQAVLGDEYVWYIADGLPNLRQLIHRR